MLSDIEIAQAAKMQPITEIAANLGLQGEDVIPYGHYKAKPHNIPSVSGLAISRAKARPRRASVWRTL